MGARPNGSGRERSSPNRCDQCRGQARHLLPESASKRPGASGPASRASRSPSGLRSRRRSTWRGGDTHRLQRPSAASCAMLARPKRPARNDACPSAIAPCAWRIKREFRMNRLEDQPGHAWRMLALPGRRRRFVTGHRRDRRPTSRSRLRSPPRRAMTSPPSAAAKRSACRDRRHRARARPVRGPLPAKRDRSAVSNASKARCRRCWSKRAKCGTDAAAAALSRARGASLVGWIHARSDRCLESRAVLPRPPCDPRSSTPLRSSPSPRRCRSAPFARRQPLADARAGRRPSRRAQPCCSRSSGALRPGDAAAWRRTGAAARLVARRRSPSFSSTRPADVAAPSLVQRRLRVAQGVVDDSRRQAQACGRSARRPR